MITRTYSIEYLDPRIEAVRSVLSSFPVHVAGRIRRRWKESNRLSFVVVGEEAPVVASLSRLKGLYFRSHGPKLIRASLDNIPLTFGLSRPLHEGSVLLTYTGHARFVKWLRREALFQRMTLNLQGLWFGSNLIASKTEQEIFRALGLAYIPPEGREKGEQWRR